MKGDITRFMQISNLQNIILSLLKNLPLLFLCAPFISLKSKLYYIYIYEYTYWILKLLSCKTRKKWLIVFFVRNLHLYLQALKLFKIHLIEVDGKQYIWLASTQNREERYFLKIDPIRDWKVGKFVLRNCRSPVHEAGLRAKVQVPLHRPIHNA